MHRFGRCVASRAAALATLAGLAVLAAPRAGATLALKRINDLLDHPVYMATTADSTLIAVVEQPGTIRIINLGTDLVLATPFLDVSTLVEYGSLDDERGLLGLAFAPNHAITGLFYVYYVADDPAPGGPGVLTVAEYDLSSNPTVADPASARILLQIPKPVTGFPEEYHNGGTLAFGPDGLLYVGIGDGQGYTGNDPNNCAQNDASIMGKLIRFDPAAIPPGGITIAGGSCPGPVDPLITVVGKGLRNPYRFSFDEANGDLYLADVGQDLAEEIDVVPAASVAPGLNFGWRVMEANGCNIADPPPAPVCNDPSLTAPAYAYSHQSGFVCGGTVIGGFVYHGSIPALKGKYLFADYCMGAIFGGDYDGTSQLLNVTDLTSQLVPDAGTLDNPTGFGVDGAGEMYVVDSPALGGAGEIFKIISVEPEPILPPDLDQFLSGGLIPGFALYPGGQTYFQVEFSTDPVGFTNSLVNNKKFASDTLLYPKKKTWKKIQKLGTGGAPIYWRVNGRTSQKGPATVHSTETRSFTVLYP